MRSHRRATRNPKLFIIGLRMCVAWALSWSLVALVPELTRFIVAATVATMVACLGALTIGVQATGQSLAAFGVSVNIVPDCTSLAPTLLLVGGILAYPAPRSWRLQGAALATLVLWGYNVGRVTLLLLVLARAPQWFDLIHVYLWQSMTVVMVAGLFAVWIRSSARLKPR